MGTNVKPRLISHVPGRYLAPGGTSNRVGVLGVPGALELQ